MEPFSGAVGDGGESRSSSPVWQPPTADGDAQWLSLWTGLTDDAREPLSKRHAVFPAAARFVPRQDSWTDDEHRAAASILLEVWPRRRGQRLRETYIAYAWAAWRLGASPDRIAQLLGISRETLRRERILDKAQKFEHEWEDMWRTTPRLPRVLIGRLEPPEPAEVELTEMRVNLEASDYRRPQYQLNHEYTLWSRFNGRS